MEGSVSKFIQVYRELLDNFLGKLFWIFFCEVCPKSMRWVYLDKLDDDILSYVMMGRDGV